MGKTYNDKFVMLPNEIHKLGLNPAAVVVYTVLLQFDRTDKALDQPRGTCWPSVQTIARRTGWKPRAERNGKPACGISPRGVHRALRALEQAGAVVTERRDGNGLQTRAGRRSSLYRLKVLAVGRLLGDATLEKLQAERGEKSDTPATTATRCAKMAVNSPIIECQNGS